MSAPQPTLVLHHLERSRSTRILWALEELGLTYTMKTHKRHPKTMRAGPEIKKIHPVGRFPVLTADGVAYAESGSVLEFLADLPGGETLRPTDGEGLRQYRYWMHFAEGSLMGPLLVSLITSKLSGKDVPFFIRPIAAQIGRTVDKSYTWPQLGDLLPFVESTLASQPWIAGDSLTMADIQMSYAVQASLSRVPGAEKYTAMKAWVDRIEARPAYKKAIEVGGPALLA